MRAPAFLRTPAAPIAAVLAGAVVLWLAGGVGVGDIALYCGYEALYVVLPGILVLLAINPGTEGWGWRLSLGWPLGLAVEICAFSLTAWLGARDLLILLPLVVGVPAALIARHRGARLMPRRIPRLPSGPMWASAGLCLAAFAYVGIPYFMEAPLPGTTSGVVYFPDVTFNIAYAAEALHHWPLTDPLVHAQAGVRYHYFAHLHMAAISQVSGIGLPLIVMRLYPVLLLALLVVQLSHAARVISGRAWAGPIAVALVLLVRSFDLSISDPGEFGGGDLLWIVFGPTTLMGIVFLTPIVLLLSCLLDPRVAARAEAGLGASRRRQWLLLALLLPAAAGVKSVIVPLLAAAIAVFGAWQWLRDRTVNRAALSALVLCGASFVLSVALIYHGGAPGVHLVFLGTLKQMPALSLIHVQLPDTALADVAFWAVATPVGTAMYFLAPTLGLVWARPGRGTRFEPAAMLAISLLIAGLPAFFLLQQDFFVQTYFPLFALLASAPVAAGGFAAFFGKRRGTMNLATTAGFVIAWTAAVVVIALLADRLATDEHPIEALALEYGPLLLVLGAMLIVAWLARTRAALLTGLAVLAVLIAAGLNIPLEVIPQTVRSLDAGSPLRFQTSPAALRPETLAGMEWIRDNVPYDAVLSVSNDRTPETRGLGPSDFDYPAFTEHRTFREGWAFTNAGDEQELKVIVGERDPFPARTALEEAVFQRADPAALLEMIRRYGVTHIVVSRLDGPVNPCVFGMGKVIYSTAAIVVIQLPTGPHPALPRRRPGPCSEPGPR